MSCSYLLSFIFATTKDEPRVRLFLFCFRISPFLVFVIYFSYSLLCFCWRILYFSCFPLYVFVPVYFYSFPFSFVFSSFSLSRKSMTTRFCRIYSYLILFIYMFIDVFFCFFLFMNVFFYFFIFIVLDKLSLSMLGFSKIDERRWFCEKEHN